MQPSEFSSLLCSRLCHDLISPVGAITNALELMDEDLDSDTKKQVMDLLRQSADQTAKKLQFFRLAFGAAGGFSETLDFREAEKALSGLVSNTKVELVWQSEVHAASKAGMKLLLALCLVVVESLVRGGELRVACPDITGDARLSDFTLTGTGARVIATEGLSDILAGKASSLPEARLAPTFLASLIAKDAGYKLIMDLPKTSEGADAQELRIRATLIE